jgi:hypothetical protein
MSHEFALLAREFRRRRFFCAGTSEAWEDDSGALYDEDTGVWLIFNGVDKAANTPQGEWGVGFMLSHFAHKLWKKSGEQMSLMSPRVAATRTH